MRSIVASLPLAVIACSQPARVPAPEPAPAVTPVVLGETFALDSTLLGERRVIAVLMAAIEQAHPAGLVVHHVPMPDQHHHTVFPFAALRGIRTRFAAPPPAE